MKPKLIGAVVVLAAALIWMRSSKEEAPLADGSFLAYESGGYVTRVTFEQTDTDEFTTRLEMVEADGESMAAIGATGDGETVSTRLRTSSGGIFEVGSLGPVWIPPSEVRVGGSAHGTRIEEMRTWEQWEVGVVSASVGMGGAFRGEWYYESGTGFLVGGTKSTAVSTAGEGQVFTLVGSNIVGLGLQ